MVWAAGFEPTTSAFQARHSAKLSYAQPFTKSEWGSRSKEHAEVNTLSAPVVQLDRSLVSEIGGPRSSRGGRAMPASFNGRMAEFDSADDGSIPSAGANG